jgi:hypothetical protein
MLFSDKQVGMSPIAFALATKCNIYTNAGYKTQNPNTRSWMGPSRRQTEIHNK